MHRSLVLALLLVPSALAAPTPAPVPVKGPTPDQIRQAIDDLASPRFAVREKASKVLWEAGKSAEEALRAAAKSKDEETANRAKAIVEKFDWGLYPDTPAEVVKLIEKFRGGDPNTRQQAVAELIHLKPARFDVLRKVIAQEQDEKTRRDMYDGMSEEARRAVPQMIVEGNAGEAAELLEICVSPNNPATLGDYAAFQHLRGRVPEAIARMEALRKHPADTQRATEVLVYLFRVKQDWAAARKAAEDAKNPDLQNDLAWEAGDWKRLAEAATDPDERGARAAYYRLAGDKAKYDEVIGELRKDSMGVEGDDGAAYRLAYALLLNGQGAEAVAVLKGRNKGGSDLMFDLLCAQLKFKEAFAYADAAAKELDDDPQAELERDQLAGRRAKTLAALGDRDGATQLFRQAVSRALAGKRDMSAIEVVQAAARSGMRDLAAECAAHCLDYFRKTDMDFEAPAALLPVFEERTHLVLSWWQAVMTDDPKADATAVMTRVLEFVDGKVDRKKADLLAELVQKARTPRAVDKDKSIPLAAVFLAGPRGDFAVAEAYRAAGATDKADEFYKKAAGTRPDRPDDPRALLDDLRDERGQGVVPTHYRYLLGYADFLLAQKRYKEATAQYRKTWEVAPSQPLPLFLLGHSLKLAGDDKEGTRLMGLAHWVLLGNEEMRAKFSEDLFKRGFDADSRQEMDLVVTTGWFRRSYAVGNVHLRLARIKARQGDYATAARLYEKDVVSLFRTGAAFVDGKAYLTVPELARTYRARALFAAGKLDEALAEARTGLAVLPGNIELGLGLIPDLDKAGRKKEADELYGKIKAAYEGALADYGSSADLRNSLAWTQVNCNRDLDDALKHAQKAVEVAPKTAGYIDTLAEVYFRKKDRPKALELMKQCAALEPGNPYFRKQLERFEKKPFDSPLPDEETGDD